MGWKRFRESNNSFMEVAARTKQGFEVENTKVG